MSRNKRTDVLTVQAKDCYDPAEFTLVHDDYLERLQRVADLTPFDGELSVFVGGRFVLGVNPPHVEAVLAAMRSALKLALSTEPHEQTGDKP